ncbi:DNA gyrase inhibitor YacG [Cribrihabitans pelagius]|uniref:DNA gyrase inhibitor YacG n=1 Tax=Cribrihabitans pelagius TaxID=1765746 RepID=UPI003B59F11F
MSCPICGADTARPYRPFCSRRCADVDLAKWMNGAYAVPSRDPEDIENALEEAERALGCEEKGRKPRHS